MSDETERVTQLWPLDLKEKVRERVGARGVTRYTLEAVQEKLARDAAADAAEPTEPEEPAIAPPVHTPPPVPETPVAVVEREPAPAQVSKLLTGETRGEDVTVTTMSTGAAAEYASSRGRVEAMLARAREMGVKNASELPIPEPKPVAEVTIPDEVLEATPEEHQTLQEQLRDPVFRVSDEEADIIAEPEPKVQTPVRDLNAIEVDF